MQTLTYSISAASISDEIQRFTVSTDTDGATPVFKILSQLSYLSAFSTNCGSAARCYRFTLNVKGNGANLVTVSYQNVIVTIVAANGAFIHACKSSLNSNN